MPEASVRPAEAADRKAVASLLYESSGGIYDRYAGSRSRAEALLERAFDQPGNNASAEVVTVAEVGGAPVGALAGFPTSESSGRSSAFLRLTMRFVPFWRWPGALWLYYTGARAAPAPGRSGLYIDALATDPEHRRRGVARALLAAAERQAAELSLSTVLLDTAADNHSARSLYLTSGFVEVAHSPPAHGLPGFVALAKDV